jgi:hypothetical protein
MACAVKRWRGLHCSYLFDETQSAKVSKAACTPDLFRSMPGTPLSRQFTPASAKSQAATGADIRAGGSAVAGTPS